MAIVGMMVSQFRRAGPGVPEMACLLRLQAGNQQHVVAPFRFSISICDLSEIPSTKFAGPYCLGAAWPARGPRRLNRGVLPQKHLFRYSIKPFLPLPPN